MRVVETSLPGVLLLYPEVQADNRGSSLEIWNLNTYFKIGIKGQLAQINQAKSHAGVLRGMHYQLNRPQAKICRLTYGIARNMVVDIRVGSPTFGQHHSWLMMVGESQPLIYVPAGFAHGFCAMNEPTIFQYFCSDFCAERDRYGINWNDPDLELPWGLKNLKEDPPIVSAQDTALPFLRDIPKEKLPQYVP